MWYCKTLYTHYTALRLAAHGSCVTVHSSQYDNVRLYETLQLSAYHRMALGATLHGSQCGTERLCKHTTQLLAYHCLAFSVALHGPLSGTSSLGIHTEQPSVYHCMSLNVTLHCHCFQCGSAVLSIHTMQLSAHNCIALSVILYKQLSAWH